MLITSTNTVATSVITTDPSKLIFSPLTNSDRLSKNTFEIQKIYKKKHYRIQLQKKNHNSLVVINAFLSQTYSLTKSKPKIATMSVFHLDI